MKQTLFILIYCLMISMLASGQEKQPEKLLREAIYKEEVNGDLGEVIKTYQMIIEQYPDNRPVAAKALLHMGLCYEKMGLKQAHKTYQEIINKYPEQKDEVVAAKERVNYLEAFAANLNRKAEQHLKEGNELFDRWEYESAIEEYKQAIKLDPNTLLAQNAGYCIGQSWFRAGEYNAALATFKKLLKENPDSNIAPVTELMIEQVEYALENNKGTEQVMNYSDANTIIDPETGITYKKVKTFMGKSDVIKWTHSACLSPTGKFLLTGKTIVPMDGSDPFNFIDMHVDDSKWSPDGKKIAFTDENSSIYVVPVSPETGRSIGNEKKLLNKDCNIYGINWSPDSKKLFFSMIDYKQKDYPEIYSITISNGEIKQITNETIPLVVPNCSPDGNFLACTSMFAELWSCPSEGGKAIKLSDNSSTRYTAPNWTPDGKWLYSDEARKGWGRSLNFIQLADKYEVKLNPPEKAGTYLSFSSDGEKILFYRPSYNFFWGMKVASSMGGPSYEPVAHLPVYGAQWSTDSKMIIIQGEKYNKMEEGDAAMRIVPIAGGESFLLDLDINVNGKPFAYNVSPNNKHLLFKVTKEDEKEDLFIIPVSVNEAKITGPAIRIIENWNRQGAHNTQLSWSADGSKLAIIHNKDIWVYNLVNKEFKQTTKAPETRKGWITWSPDGSMLSYQGLDNKQGHKQGSTIITSTGGEPIKIIENYLLWHHCWSLDSRSVVYLREDKVVSQNIQTDEIHVILDLNSHWLKEVVRYCWSPDGKYILIDGRKKSEPNKYYLYKIPAKGGELTEIATGDSSYKYDISWSPDGKWICYCYYEMEKVRPEGTLWEANFEEVKEKLLQSNNQN